MFRVLATAAAVGTVIIGVVVSGPPGKASAATTSTDIYVDNLAPDCNAGNGTEALPFCTISAAAAVAQPGQTVHVYQGRLGAFGGDYPAQSIINVSGTASKPITFQAENLGYGVNVASFEIAGAQNVVFSGFNTGYYDVGGSPSVGYSSGITINGGTASGSPQHPAVLIDGGSDVTVSRGSFTSYGGPAIQVFGGTPGVVITGNTVTGQGDYPAILVSSDGTDVTGNTVLAGCGPGISVTNSLAGTSIENNIIETGRASAGTCTTAGDTTGISIDPSSSFDTTTGYNLIYPPAGQPLYNWAGTPYTSLPAFQAATGQGAHDIAANPDLGPQVTQNLLGVGRAVFYPLENGSPAIDSANADAPGELPRDQLDNPRTDDPNVANTGAGSGTGTSTHYFDRGAVEVEGPVSLGGATMVPSGPLTVTATQRSTPSWVTNGPIGEFEFNFGDSPYPVITSSNTVQHTYATAGVHTVNDYQTYGNPSGIHYQDTATTVVGADYTPVAPTRILDTRNGTGTGKAAAVPAGGTLTLPIPATDGVTPADMSAVVMNVTVTGPTGSGYLPVYPAGGTAPNASNLNFSKGMTVSNLVTVKASGGKVSFRNSSSGTVQVIADLEGFYGPGGYGYQPKPPVRVLDTRNGTGGVGQPLSSWARIRLNLSGKVPAGTKAVVLNLTVTGPKKAGYLTAYPDAPTRPNASNLNFTAGETRANLVIVPLNNGIVDIYNASPGTVEAIADLEGYFTTGAPDSFVPVAPVRLVDTTKGLGGGPLTAGKTINIKAYSYSCYPSCPQPVAIVANMIVTAPTRSGYLTVYPYKGSLPNASNLDFLAGETIPNLTMTQATSGTVTAHNASAGTTQLVVDEYGYFIASAR